MTVVHLSPEEMAAFRESETADPAIAKHNQLIRDYATKQGGLALEFWSLHMGRIFGSPWFMSLDECAKRLNVPASRLHKVAEETWKVVGPQWEASEEYKRSDYARLRSRTGH